jgi:hypothetical protein
MCRTGLFQKLRLCLTKGYQTHNRSSLAVQGKIKKWKFLNLTTGERNTLTALESQHLLLIVLAPQHTYILH